MNKDKLILRNTNSSHISAAIIPESPTTISETIAITSAAPLPQSQNTNTAIVVDPEKPKAWTIIDNFWHHQLLSDQKLIKSQHSPYTKQAM